jgi:hypothetical protein
VSKAKTHWNGPALVVETVRTITSGSGERVFHFTDTFRIDSGGQLVFERLTKFQQGDPQTVSVVYRRAR